MIDVIIPVYNTDTALLKRCLDSIEAQGSGFNAIVIDDGSNAETAEFIDDYVENKSERTSVFHIENVGVSAARNFAIENSCGEWIMFADSDDELLPDCLSRARRLAQHYDADVVIGGSNMVFDSKIVPHTISADEPIVYEGEQKYALEKYILTIQTEKGSHELKNAIFAGPWAKLIKRECIGDNRFPVNIPIGEDVVFNLKLFSNANRIVMDNQIYYNYYQYSTSAINRYRPNGVEERKMAIELYYDLGKSMPQIQQAVYFKILREVRRIMSSTLFNPNGRCEHPVARLREIFSWQQVEESLKNIDLSLYESLSFTAKVAYRLMIYKCILGLCAFYQIKKYIGVKN